MKLFLTDGILSFLEPVGGRVPGAVFTTENVEGGDLEVLALPPLRSERRALAAATGTPNLDEHLQMAILLFSDQTEAELRRETDRLTPLPASAESGAAAINARYGRSLAVLGRSASLRLVGAMLGNVNQGFFLAALTGRHLGAFTFFYDPLSPEPVTLGRTRAETLEPPGDRDASGIERGNYELWSAYTPRTAAPYQAPGTAFSDYRIDATVRGDLSLEAEAEFIYESGVAGGRVLPLELSQRLQVDAAFLDEKAAEVLQRTDSDAFLLVSPGPLGAGPHRVRIRYHGKVIERMPNGGYLVNERTDWFPSGPGFSARFDLTLRCPAELHIVATGEPVSEEVVGNQRVVQRRLSSPRPLAGFNLGNYHIGRLEAGSYRLELAETGSANSATPDLLEQARRVLPAYTRMWGVVPARTLTISPIAGNFGQGFPGLVYLSETAYRREAQRPHNLQGAAYDFFFSQLLLPHEIAHQWWGNLITSASYESAWFLEAMATYAALDYLDRQPAAHGRLLADVLDQYRQHLLADVPGKVATPEAGQVEQAGPLAWGTRILANAGREAWQTVVYEKGAWVLHMLRQQLGEPDFAQFQRTLLRDFSSRPFTNDDLRETAARLLPKTGERANRNDPELRQFFHSWVEETGVPTLRLHRDGREWLLTVTDVEPGFTLDVPLHCTLAARDVHFYLRAQTGENSLPARLLGAKSCSLPSPAELLYRR